MAVTQSDSYSKKIQKEAFEKAYTLVNEVIKKEVSYFLNVTDNREERVQYESLCRKLKKDINLPKLEDKTDKYKRKQGMPEKDFVKKIKNAKTSRQLGMLIKRLGEYDQGIELKEFESWNVLVIKTFEIEKSIKRITNYLKEQSYPHTDFYTTNSKYLHFCVASALKELNTRDEMSDYLFENGGHGGFINIMRSYEVNGDKEMCITLFEHFYNFCRFLVY